MNLSCYISCVKIRTVMDNYLYDSAAYSLCSIPNLAKFTFLSRKHDGLVSQSKIPSKEACSPPNHQNCAGNNFEHQTYHLQSIRPFFKSINQGREITFCSPSAHLICSSRRTSLGMHHLHLFYRGNKGSKS